MIAHPPGSLAVDYTPPAAPRPSIKHLPGYDVALLREVAEAIRPILAPFGLGWLSHMAAATAVRTVLRLQEASR